MNSSLRQTFLFAAFLIFMGGLIFYAKVVQYSYPMLPGAQTPTWDFETYLEFTGTDRPARLEVFIPTSVGDHQILQEQFFNGPFGLSLVDENKDKNRQAIWTYRFPNNRKVLRYRANIVGDTLSSPISGRPSQRRSNGAKRQPDAIKRQALIVWSDELRRRSADDRSYASLTLEDIFADQMSDEIESLLPGSANPVNKLTLAAEALQNQGIWARVVNGVYLDGGQRRRAEISHWLDYRADGEDFRYFIGERPEHFFPIWYGSQEMVTSSGVSELGVQISLQPSSELAKDLARQSAVRQFAPVTVFGFDQLPLTTQLVYKILITIPVGIVLLVFLRQFVGITTLGTFMPVLIGISFRETALFNGIMLFSLLVGLGLGMRFFLERLQLLLVPRLAVVLIFIVVLMATITVLMNESNRSVGLSISLFPMVILTMTIERMSIVWEEYSATEAIKQGVGSLVVASITYLAMTNNVVEHMMFVFPELLLVLMGVCLLMGRYTGLRLSEFWRFRFLGRS